MSKNKQHTTVIIDLKPSGNLSRLNTALHLLAVGAGIANALPTPIKLAIIIMILANFILTGRDLKLESRKICYSGKGGWKIITGNETDMIEILSSTVISTWIIFLHIKAKKPIIIFHDAMDEKNFRQLIVMLKMTPP